MKQSNAGLGKMTRGQIQRLRSDGGTTGDLFACGLSRERIEAANKAAIVGGEKTRQYEAHKRATLQTIHDPQEIEDDRQAWTKSHKY